MLQNTKCGFELAIKTSLSQLQVGTKKQEDPTDIAIQVVREQKYRTENESRTQTLLSIDIVPRDIKDNTGR